MKIIVDAMGGDNAPKAAAEGSMLAVKKLGVEIILTGKKEQIKRYLTDDKNIAVVETSQMITNDDEPAKAVRAKPDSSMLKGLAMVAAQEGDAFVSAGNTGALVAGATLIVKRIKGIRRVALAPIIPAGGRPVILIDGGANVDCTPEMLGQFGIMGSIYSSAVFGVEKPAVGLLNNGTEHSKGNKAAAEAYELLSELPINFAGNIEGRDVLSGKVDVLVADGFVGNILLKSIEGTALYFASNLKQMLTKNIATKISAVILKGGLSEFKKKFDYNEHGGAPVLGANAAIIKAHGSSKEVAFYNAIRQAKSFCEAEAIKAITNLVKNS
ncbi:MAG: phosphate acyltransferase PlsX [Firmicutes bacterium]|nr:phosphate acyltransferase PlsX [Bacillota bacterium]